jgi:hypothetical protein
LLAFCTKSFGQSGKLSGSVIDTETKNGLELATVSIFNQDSTLVTYQLTNRDGKFVFEKLPLKKEIIGQHQLHWLC